MRNFTIEFQPSAITVVEREDGAITNVTSEHIDEEIVQVFTNDKYVRVTLKDGTVGEAKCSPEDDFLLWTGVNIAWSRAKVKQFKKTIRNSSGY